MNIPQAILEPFGVLGFPKPMVNPCTEIVDVADPMAMLQALVIEKQEIIAKVSKLTVRWYGGEEAYEDENGIYEVSSCDSPK